jgi:hypothetical protein
MQRGVAVASISPTTGQTFYSGEWEDIRSVLSVLDIDEGKLSTISELDVNYYQEMVDRDIDAILEELYHTPLRSMNRVQPDGTTKLVFPGDVRRAARYWTAALVMMNQFQQLSQNLTDQATSYIEDARKQIHELRRFNHRIPGQVRKSHLSRTMPPSMQPAAIPEPNF